MRRSRTSGRAGKGGLRTRRPFGLLAVLVVCLLAGSASAATFYVRSSGNDEQDGLSPATAVRSIRVAAQRVQNPGDTVVVGPGEYFEGDVAPARSGIAGRPVLFVADASGARTGDSAGPVRLIPQPEHAAGFLLLGKRFVEIRGFEIRGGSDAAVQVRSDRDGVPSSDIGLFELTVAQAPKRGLDVTAGGAVTIARCTVSGSGSTGINVQGEGENTAVTILGSRVEGSGAQGVAVTGVQRLSLEDSRVVGSSGQGVRVRAARQVSILKSELSGNREEGLQIGPPDPTQVQDLVTDVRLEGNTVADNGKSGILLSAAGGVTVKGNSVQRSAAAGLVVRGVNVGSFAGFEIEENEIRGAAADCLAVTGVPSVVLQTSRIATCGSNGIRIENAGRGVVRANEVNATRGTGVRIVDVEEASLIGNRVSGGTSSVGISVEGNPDRSLFRLLGNRVSDFPAGGIVLSSALAARLVGNEISNVSQNDAIIVRSVARAEVRQSILRSLPQGYGIAVGTATDRTTRSVRVRRNRTERAGKGGVRVFSSGTVTVAENEVHESGLGGGIVIEGTGSTLAFVQRNIVRSAGASGVFLRSLRGGEVGNNRVLSNGQSGIVLRTTEDVRVWNNLIYGNAGEGIEVGSGGEWSVRTVVSFNTVYANQLRGLRIDGPETGRIEGGMVLNNIFAGNVGGGMAVARSAMDNFVAGFNVNPDGYVMETRRNDFDLLEQPLFVSPAGPDGVLGGLGFADDDFHLQQRRSGYPSDSPGVDAGSDDAEVIGIGGSTSADGTLDTGRVDVGFHYGGADSQQARLNIPFMPLFVREVGSATADGRTPESAVASLRSVTERAVAGATIVVGPGRYREGDIRIKNFSGRVALVADPTGELTGDPPGPVLIDAGGFDTGFVIVNGGPVTLRGFAVTGARTAAIQIRAGADGALVADNVVFSNERRGIEVNGANSVTIRNNLVYANGTGGIQLQASRASTVTNNTVYGNGAIGILVGVNSADGAAPDTVLERNIVAANQTQIKVETNSLTGYVSRFNVVFGPTPFAASTPRAASDLVADPLFVNPAGEDAVLGSTGFADDNFRLQQLPAGVVSPAVDLDPGEAHAMAAGTTSEVGFPDLGAIDAGFHYPVGSDPIPPDTVVFVRSDGDDRNDGRSPTSAFRSLAAALERGSGRSLAVIAPGTYRVGSLRIGGARSPATEWLIYGDRSGALTSQPPGAVVFDFGGTPGLTILGPATLQGLELRNSDRAAVRVLAAARRFTLRDTTVCTGAGDGIVSAAERTDLINNRICGNAGWGVRVTARRRGSLIRLLNNTIADNGAGAVQAVDRNRAAVSLRISNNIMARNGAGLFLFAGSRRLVPWGANLNEDGYSRQAETLPLDISAEPQFVCVWGDVGCAARVAYLLLPGSPAVDAGVGGLLELGLWGRSSLANGTPDLGAVDLGYHQLPF